MSKIGRYEFMCSHSGSISRREDGPWITFVDHERDIAEKVAAERKRCREQEVNVLKTTLADAIGMRVVLFRNSDPEGDTDTLADCDLPDEILRRWRGVMGAVQKIQKELP